MVCIYCKKQKGDTEFSLKRGDEIIPRFLGRFGWSFGNDVVCKQCNNKLSKAETIFKEGSIAGIHSAVYGIDNKRASIRVRKERINWTVSSRNGEIGVFKDIFPFVKLPDSNTRPRSIVILDHRDSKIKHILFVEKYASFAERQKTKNFQRRKESIGKFRQRFGKLDISLFGDTKKGWTIEKIIKLLKDYDLNYNKRIEEGFEDKKRGTKWFIDYNENGDAETLRTPAKIAFNYFAFCAKKDNMLDILLGPNFDYIRRYVRHKELPPVDYKPIFNYDKNPKDKRGIHIVSFQREKNFITSFVSLFNRFNYRIVLGKYPFNTESGNFGCATAFNPFSREIMTSIYSSPYPKIGKPEYGLFCR